VFGLVPGSQSASEGYGSSRQPSCPERASRVGAGAQCSEHEAAARAAAAAAAPGKSAETTPGDRDAKKNSQSQGASGHDSRVAAHLLHHGALNVEEALFSSTHAEGPTVSSSRMYSCYPI